MSPDQLLSMIAEIEELPEPARADGLDQLRNQPELAELDPATAFRVARLFSLSPDPSDLPIVAELGAKAHDAGMPGAGLLFAEAADKLCLYSGRPQRYGTVMVEHQGDVVQPPVDPAVTDDQRRELGLPSLTEQRQRMAEATRQLAEERATKPGFLPPGERFCRVWTNPDPAQLRARMAAEGATAWADGDVITFVCESPDPVAVTPVFPISTWDAGDGLQVLSVRVERAAEAIITYTFTPMAGPGGGPPMNFRRGSHDGRFRGADAPAELPSNDPLVGTMVDHVVESDALGGPRALTVYLPPEVEPGAAGDVPVIYATDGNMFAPYARRLDAAIQSGLCPSVTVVAAHAAPMNPMEGNQRALEYLMGFDDARFAAHQRFFVVELAAWAETELGVATDPARRGVFGCSDGAGHALTTARLNPTKFGHVFAFSTGMPPDPSTTWDGATHPMAHLCAGTLEGGFFQATEAWAGFLHLQGAQAHFTERVAGHDLIQWGEELPRAVDRAWG